MSLELDEKRSHYTLIELLVTLSIIATLVSLLFAALEKGKDKVEEIACVKNLKNLTSALFQYAGDNQGKAPMGVQDSMGHLGPPNQHTSWDDLLSVYVGLDWGLERIENLGVFDKSQGYTEDDAGLLICPASDFVANGNKVRKSYSMHRWNNKGISGSEKPWRTDTVRGISCKTFAHISAPNSRQYGYAAVLGMISNASTAIAFTEFNSANNKIGDTATPGVITLKRFGEYLGPTSSKFDDDFTLEKAWPHGFGMISYMLVDGHVEHKDIVDTVDPRVADVWSEEKEFFTGTGKANGLWDCFDGRPTNY